MENSPLENSIDLSFVPKLIWKSKIIIISSSILGLLVSSYYLYNTIFTYEVKLNVVPIEGSKIGSNPSGLIQMLAVGAGYDGESSDFSLYLDLIQSRAISDYIYNEKKELFILLFKSQWDDKSNKWIENKESFLSKTKSTIKSLLGIPVFKRLSPNSESLHGFLLQNIKISRSMDNNLTTISIDIEDPIIGKTLLLNLHNFSNNYLKERKRRRATENIRFIDQSLIKTQKADQRIALIQFLSQQQKILIETSSSLPFASEKFGDIIIPNTPNKPNPNLILMLGLLLGFFGSITFVLFKHHFRNFILK